MEELRRGLYRISPVPFGPGVGANTSMGPPQRPVVLEGADHIWHVEPVEPFEHSLYRLVLLGRWYSNDADHKVIVDENLAPGEVWRIHRWGNSAFFIIEKEWRALPRLVWTLPEKIPGEQVVLREPREPHEHQQWYFEPIHRD